MFTLSNLTLSTFALALAPLAITVAQEPVTQHAVTQDPVAPDTTAPDTTGQDAPAPESTAAPVAEDFVRLDPRAPLPDAETIAQLPPDGGPEFNRLIFEDSPYLRQHARNPVDWWPWCDEAFQKAAELDLPVFVSVGYASCHWCHVMERESFGDDVIAEGLNTQYICIKVDREERPDIDAVLMAYTQFFGKPGGWPLNVFMTPEKEPFWANSFMPRDGTLSKMGMVQVLPYIYRGWRGQRNGIHRRSQEVMLRVAKSMGRSSTAMEASDALDLSFTDLSKRFDAQDGGWGFLDREGKLQLGTKFPVPHNIRFLLRYADRTGNEHARTMALTTLRGMARGGMRDLLNGGFHRYSTDTYWRQPHWEKLLRDQVALAIAYTEAYQMTGDPFFRTVATETLDYVLGTLTSPDGAFWTGEDAENIEDWASGQSFSMLHTWAELDVLMALESDNDVTFATSVFGITEDGNFYDERTKTLTGRNLISMIAPRETLAPQMYPQFDDVERQLEAFDKQYDRVTGLLRAAKNQRSFPLIDTKVLTDLNGTAIAAFAMAGRTFDEPRYVQAAERAMRFLDQNLRMPAVEGDTSPPRFYHRMANGVPGVLGYANDHVNVLIGLLELYKATGSTEWLAMAVDTAELTINHFWDFDEGGLFTTANDAEMLYVRPREEQDTSTPSANSVFAEGLVRLARLTGKRDYETRYVQQIFDFQTARVKDGGASWRTHLMLALEHAIGENHELVVVGDPSQEAVREALATIRSGFYPTTVVIVRPAGEEIGALAELAPHVAAQDAVDGQPTFYLCRNQTCEAPTTDFATVLKSLRGE